jgi:hypothetical protein
MPGDIAENCAFLARRVDEVGLLFLDSVACLAYGKRDLPDFLAELPLFYHAHLPTDLPMHDPTRAAAICAALLDAADHLPHRNSARAAAECATRLQNEDAADSRRLRETQRMRRGGGMTAVLHPPLRDPADSALAARRTAAFAEAWLRLGKDPSQLLLENVRGNDLTCLTGPVRDYAFGLCLDMGHALAFGQDRLLRRGDLLRNVRMLHAHAPGRNGRPDAHLPLTALDAAGRRQAERMCKSAPRHAVIMMEMFSWRHIEESLPVIRPWI